MVAARRKLMCSQQAQFEHLLNRADDLVVVIDRSYSLVDINESAEKFCRCKRESIIGRNLFEIAVEQNWQLPASLLIPRNVLKRINWSVMTLSEGCGKKDIC